MFENHAWFDYKNNINFKDYVLSLPDNDLEGILSNIPSGWNFPDKSHNHFIEWLIKKLNPQVIVDLGVDYGYSSFLMSYLSSGQVFGIDCFDVSKHSPREDNDYQFVVDIKNKLKLDNLKIIKGYFDDVAKQWGSKIDILHIDGLHDYENCKNDFLMWSNFVDCKNGVILFHDTVSNADGVGRFFKELSMPKINFMNSCGLGVIHHDPLFIQEINDSFTTSGYPR